MKTMNQHVIALALATLAVLPWRVFNRSGGAGQDDEHWYRIDNNLADAGKPIEVLVYGEIGGWGITAEQFFRDLAAVDDGVRQIHIGFNSNGGDISDGFAMHNGLSRLGERCVGRIDGFALSAAGIAVTGCHKVWMADNAMFMMHNPWTWTGGDSGVFRKMADVLDQLVNGIIASFKHRPITVDDDELRRMINAETWLTAEEAKAIGLVDEILTGAKPVNNHGDTRIFNRYQNIPAAVKAEIEEPPEPDPEPGPELAPSDPPAPEPEPQADPEPAQLAAALAVEVIEACTKEGISNLAPHIIKASGLKSQADVQNAIAKAKDIRAQCVAARIPEKAGEFISMGLTPDQARARLFDALVGKGFGEIDNKPPSHNPAPEANARAVNPGDIYAKRKTNAAKGAA